MTRPTVVIVHGAWHTPAHFESFIKSIADIDVRTVRLPSSGPDISALGDMRDDAAEVRKVVSAIDGPVLVLAHSYGGVPVTEALGPASENVKRITYLASFPLDVGESMVSVATQGGTLPHPPNWDVHKDEGYILVKDPAFHFYDDVEPALAQKALDDLTYQSWSSQIQPLTNAAWREIPSTYVITDQDRILPIFAQEMFSQRTTDVRHIDSSHSPFLSRPAELAAILREEITRTN
ncbi:MAG TPA: alpha/beta hydrolase [Trebonia sp.]